MDTRVLLRFFQGTGVVFLTLLVLFSCEKKDDPSLQCDDGTCCMKDGGTYHYSETLGGVPADLSGRSLVLKEGVPTQAVHPSIKTRVVEICDLSPAKTTGLANSVPYTDPSAPYPYRVWGKTYARTDVTRTYPAPIMYIVLERIEKVE